MTREQLNLKYKHVLGGMILDGMTPRDGPAKSLFVSTIMAKVDAVLTAIHADLVPDLKPSANGQPKEPARAPQR